MKTIFKQLLIHLYPTRFRVFMDMRPLNFSLFQNLHLINTVGYEEVLPENSNYSKVSILVSFAALISMYSLYSLRWTRERVLYLHKPPAEQRELVLISD
jgi:hypothetical protein